VADLKNFVTAGRYGGCLALAPDDSPLLLRATRIQDIILSTGKRPNQQRARADSFVIRSSEVRLPQLISALELPPRGGYRLQLLSKGWRGINPFRNRFP
jgi:hypothetical protein